MSASHYSCCINNSEDKVVLLEARRELEFSWFTILSQNLSENITAQLLYHGENFNYCDAQTAKEMPVYYRERENDAY